MNQDKLAPERPHARPATGTPPDDDAWASVRRSPDGGRTPADGDRLLPPAEAATMALNKRDVLRARARALAREPQTQGPALGRIEVVDFLLAEERYGIESTWVREVYPLRDLTPLPCTPSFVLGIINVRGQILAVIDVRRFFDLPLKGLTDLNKVIILRGEQMQVGILADRIFGVRSVPLDELQPPLPTHTGVRADYLKGVTSDRLAVLDAGRILDDERLVVHEEVQG